MTRFVFIVLLFLSSKFSSAAPSLQQARAAEPLRRGLSAARFLVPFVGHTGRVHFGDAVDSVSPTRCCRLEHRHETTALTASQTAATNAAFVVLEVSLITKTSMWRTKSTCWSAVSLSVFRVFSFTLVTVLFCETAAVASNKAAATFRTASHLKIECPIRVPLTELTCPLQS